MKDAKLRIIRRNVTFLQWSTRYNVLSQGKTNFYLSSILLAVFIEIIA